MHRRLPAVLVEALWGALGIFGDRLLPLRHAGRRTRRHRPGCDRTRRGLLRRWLLSPGAETDGGEALEQRHARLVGVIIRLALLGAHLVLRRQRELVDA